MAARARHLRFRRIAIGLMTGAALLPLLASNQAQANTADYPDSRRMYWAPTYGFTWTDEPSSCLTVTYCHRVEQVLAWEEWPSLTQVDYSRTPSMYGAYEHELRFYDRSASRPLWCDYYPPYFYTNAYFDLPSGWYEDTLDRDLGEFSFGFKTWRVLEDYWYDIRFNCSPERDFLGRTWPDSDFYTQKWTGSHNVLGQIGHCHTTSNCTTFNRFADTTTALIVKLAAQAPDFESWYLSYDSDYSFEFSNPGYNVSVTGGTFTSLCGSAYHGSCYWRLNPSSSTATSRVRILGQSYPLTIHATNDATNEFHVRCPSGPNSNNCQARLYVKGETSSGAETATYYGPWVTITRGSGWWWMATHTRADTPPDSPYNFDFPSNTRQWRFVLQGGAGDTLDVDYHNTRIQL